MSGIQGTLWDVSGALMTDFNQEWEELVAIG